MMQAGKTLSVRKWQGAFNPEGQLDIAKTLNRIHRGVRSNFIVQFCFLVLAQLYLLIGNSFAFDHCVIIA